MMTNVSTTLNTRILNSLKPYIQKRIITSYEYQIKHMIFKSISPPFKIFTPAVKKELNSLIKTQIITQIHENYISHYPQEYPIKIESKFLYLIQQQYSSVPILHCQLVLSIKLNFINNIKNHIHQFDIILQKASFMSIFLQCVKNSLKKIQSKYNINTDESAQFLIDNSIDYRDPQYYIQAILTFMNNLDTFHDSDQYNIFENVKTVMSQFLIPLIGPVTIDVYMEFRRIMKKQCSQLYKLSDITRSFFWLIFDDSFAVDIDIEYDDELFKYCLTNIMKLIRKNNKYDDSFDNDLKSENEIILTGFSLFYAFVCLLDDSKEIPPEGALLIDDMVKDIDRYDIYDDVSDKDDGSKKLECLKNYVNYKYH